VPQEEVHELDSIKGLVLLPCAPTGQQQQQGYHQQEQEQHPEQLDYLAVLSHRCVAVV
jgi:hypothetical protein